MFMAPLAAHECGMQEGEIDGSKVAGGWVGGWEIGLQEVTQRKGAQQTEGWEIGLLA